VTLAWAPRSPGSPAAVPADGGRGARGVCAEERAEPEGEDAAHRGAQ
jgi:hypothetical protein